MLLSLFFGGLIVSVKIGGGSNLHNMDAYFVLLVTISGYVFWERMRFDQDIPQYNRYSEPLRWAAAFAIVIQIVLILQSVNLVSYPDRERDQKDLITLNQKILNVYNSGGEVLFISERQLQVFDLVIDIPLVDEYEKLELMEMAMARNQEYLKDFFADISNQRFALIITDSIQTNIKDESEAFSEENNIWVEEVTLHLIDYYEFSRLGKRSNIILLTPR
jgi:hypothetical protein